ncbi:TonB-dependent receptor [uncultured Dysgonomonas sp.]|uniref:SusC/RagA family TonB-linked outer membrane protein n=1 Tax=uncultured Dysgonomonas sp. TaxID=206096 RepID=UPI00280427C4|nr:TonB-dependent receptor [uncultured Dysgonomonas sp.]
MRKILLLLLTLSCYIQLFSQEITGVISDNTGEPIIGATVALKGKAVGSLTDIDGKYSIKVDNSNDVLVFSYVGYIRQEIKVGNQKQINVVLIESAKELDEVVVVGYGVQKKALLTGANSNIKGEKITELKSASAMEALQGVAPGVSITRNNGAPGSGTKVTIRGMGTIGNANPLYIVDGVSVGSIDYLSPSDIESIDVLKDGASAAIYGSRAANGVIIVTTKKGEKGAAPTISYDGYYGVQNIYKKLPTLNAQEYMYIFDEARSNEGLPLFDWQNMIVNGNNYLNTTFGNGVGQQYGQYVWDKLQSGWKGTDWVDEITQKDAPVQSHTISITGSGTDVVYSAGFSYFDQQSILGGNVTDAGYRRFTGRLNTEFVLMKNGNNPMLTLGENLTYTNTVNRGIGNGNIYWNDMHDAMTATPLMPARWTENENVLSSTYGYGPAMEGISNNQINPLARMFFRHNYGYGSGNTIVGNVYAVFEPISKLKIRSSLGVNSWFGKSRSYTPTYHLGKLHESNVEGARQEMNMGAVLTWTNTASYEIKIDEHKVSGLVGTELVDNMTNEVLGGSRNGSKYSDLSKYPYLDRTKPATSISDMSLWGADWSAGGGGLMSYMARLTYNFKEKYMVDFTFRADGSSNFAKGNRWGYFPSISAGWNFSEESFMQPTSTWLTYGKLRASWGQNGNQNIPNFVYTSNIAYNNQGYFFGPNKEIPDVAAVPANVPNPDVKWETSEQLNIGLDAKFLNSRLGLTFDYYVKTTKDWLVRAPILGTYGAGAPYINGGDVENKGFEIAVTWEDSFNDFKYGVTASGAYNKNKVTRLANAEGVILGASDILSQGTSYVSRVEVGHPIGYFYGYKTAGIFQNQQEVDAYVDKDGKPIVIGSESGIARKPGDVRFVDQNGDGVIDEKDKVMLGKPSPDFELGLQLNAEYKGFYLNTTLTGKLGLQVMQSYRSFADILTQNYTTQIFNRWHGEGTSNKLPRLTYTSNANTNLISDIYMHDADYVRVSNLTFGYHFDKLLKKSKIIKRASVYVAVNNLYTFTKYDGMDPERGWMGNDTQENGQYVYGWASGIDLGLFPLPRTVMFGINITL